MTQDNLVSAVFQKEVVKHGKHLFRLLSLRNQKTTVQFQRGSYVFCATEGTLKARVILHESHTKNGYQQAKNTKF
jgi:hypothetical protein